MSADEEPALGAFARDEHRGSIGIVMEVHGQTVWLRPIAGGLEWTATRRFVTALDLAKAASEVLSVRVADANRRSSRGGP